MLVLEFNNGKISPEEFEDIFWHKASADQNRAFMIYNDFERCPEEPNHFSVVFPFKSPALSIGGSRGSKS